MQRIFNDRKKIVSLHFIMKRLVYINCFSAILLVLSLFAAKISNPSPVALDCSPKVLFLCDKQQIWLS